MKKILLNMSAVMIITSVPLGTIACNFNPWFANQDNREDLVSMLNTKNYSQITTDWSYYNFVKKYETKIKDAASEQSKKEFDDLLNPSVTPQIWNNFENLEYDLTHTQLNTSNPSFVTDVNWAKMYHQGGLSGSEFEKAKIQTLKFYNIIANEKLYKKKNILKLVQKLQFATLDPNIFAQTTFIPYFNIQYIEVGKFFANQRIINNTYNNAYGATNSLISTAVHEYGHALSSFFSVESSLRNQFNSKPYFNNTFNNAKINITIHEKIFDRTALLMNYLNEEARIDNNATKRSLFPLIVVRSNYGRARWLEHNKGKNDEFFAEAFDQWLETPKEDRHWNWQLLNNFFMHKLPNYL